MRSENGDQPSIGIAGASARAAAFSAIRAGFDPVCWDLYGDVDLAAAATARSVPALDDPDLLQEAARAGNPLIYTGGVENHPDWIEAAQQQAPLWGNTAEVVRRVRDPHDVVERLRETRLPALDVRPESDPPPRDGTWLLKPLCGAGGRGVVRWTSNAAEHATLREPHYFQRLAEGEAYSAVFVGHEPPGDVNFVGITRQVIGWAPLHAPEFAWCGSVGPTALEVGSEHLMRRFGNILMWKFRLRGLFGCDFVVDSDGTPWLTEINPRYPASAEVFELACGFTLLRSHAAAFGSTWEGEGRRFRTSLDGLVGKGVLFAERDFEMPEVPVSSIARPEDSLGRIADVTAPGTLVRAGQPVCTFLVDGKTEQAVLDALAGAAAAFESLLGTPAGATNGRPA
ncbi:MAG: ATP-grasp domain-containing protein [Planctomyces sp.]|nr:ATP-grasp domain-containing protein [Planctomyces sp.]